MKLEKLKITSFESILKIPNGCRLKVNFDNDTSILIFIDCFYNTERHQLDQLKSYMNRLLSNGFLVEIDEEVTKMFFNSLK